MMGISVKPKIEMSPPTRASSSCSLRASGTLILPSSARHIPVIRRSAIIIGCNMAIRPSGDSFLENLAQPPGHNLLLVRLQRQHGDQDPLVARAVDAAD